MCAVEAWLFNQRVNETRMVQTEPGAYEAFYAELAEALRSGGPPPVDPRDSVQGLRIIEAAFESARTGAVVPFEAYG